MGLEEIKLEISWNAVAKNPIQKCFYQQSRGILIVYDITNKESFDNIGTWNKQIEDNASASAIKFLIGNKIDRKEERAISMAEGLELAGELDMTYYETSIEIKDKVEEMLKDMIRKIQQESFTSDRVTVVLKSSYIAKKTGCC